MKRLVLIIFIASATSAFSQKVPEKCNDLPYAKVDVMPEITNDLAKMIKSDLTSDMKKGSFEAKYKFYVNCKGGVDNAKYSTGNLNESQQTWLNAIMEKSEWKAAVLNDQYVTSLVFVTVYITNGAVKVELFRRK